AGLAEVPVMVRRLSETEQLGAMLVENLQRRALDPIHEARAYRRLHQAGLSTAEIGRMVGRGQSTVSHLMKLCKLPEDLAAEVASGRMAVETGKALSRFADRPEVLRRVLADARRYGLNYQVINALDDNGEAPAQRRREAVLPTSVPPSELRMGGAAPMTWSAAAERALILRFLRRRAESCAGAGRVALRTAADAIETLGHLGGDEA